METIETVVIRRSNDENTVAILTCNQTDDIADAAGFRDALRKAVSDWVDRTTDGRDAYAGNNNDFNVGDLAQWDDDPMLLELMKLQGITGFEIQVYCDVRPARGWDYDDNLVNEARVANTTITCANVGTPNAAEEKQC